MVISYLRELALLIDEGDDVHGLVGDHVQRVLVVSELNVLPADVLQVVLLLLQLEDVADKELLQVLICKVDAQLLEAAVGKSEQKMQKNDAKALTMQTGVINKFFSSFHVR